MAGTFGYGLRGFAGGFQTGLGLGMERKKIKMLQEEQKRAEKLAKEKEENAMNWYNTNKDGLVNFQTQPQDTRNMLIFESIKYSDGWHKYLRDCEDALQAGDLEELKHLNDMEEEKIKAERDMLGLGVRPENAFIGKHYSEADMEYVKKLQIGKSPIKPIGTQMYEEEFGELPEEVKTPTAADRKYNWAIENYEAGKISFEQLSKFMGTDISDPEKRNTIQQKLDELDGLGATPEEKKNYLLGKPEPKPEAVTTLKNWEDMFDMKKEDGIKTEEEYNRALNLLAQSEDVYKPKYATWKEALIAEVKGIAKELKGITDKEDFNTLLNVYMQKLEEIKTKYPDVDLNQFPEFEEQKGWFERLKEKVGL